MDESEIIEEVYAAISDMEKEAAAEFVGNLVDTLEVMQESLETYD